MTRAFSRPVHSSQVTPHRQLEAVVRRHLDSPWRRPISDTARHVVDSLIPWLADFPGLILDAGCGTGESTARLARRHSQSAVIGIDKSAHRLGRARGLPDNARLVRVDLADFWRLAYQRGWRPAAHYLLYPNPWPKPGQFKRRWHAHPVWPYLLALGGAIELRCNWAVYAREFALALEISGVANVEVLSFTAPEPLSAFERKYAASGHRLFRVTANLEMIDHARFALDSDCPVPAFPVSGPAEPG